MSVVFEPLEAALLRQFLLELVSLLEVEAGGAPGPADGDLADLDAVETLADLEALTAGVSAPEDPVLRRLLPDAYPDDAEASSDFRRFTQEGLVGRKHASAMLALRSLTAAAPQTDPSVAESAPGGHPLDAVPDEPIEVVLGAEDAQSWLAALNDIRLALGVRLGVEQDDDDRWAALPDTDPRATIHEVYSWLGWLQETLVRAL